MDLGTNSLAALAVARRSATTLESEKARAEAPDESKPAAQAVPGKGTVAGALEALGAVVPTTLMTLYSTGAVAVQTWAISRGADARAAREAEFAKAANNDVEKIADAMADLPVETSELVYLRIGIAVVFAALVYLFTRKAAKDASGDKNPLAEPLAATFAFGAWAFASPGTFMAAFLKPEDLAGVTAVTAVLAAAVLVVAGQYLKNPKKPQPVATA